MGTEEKKDIELSSNRNEIKKAEDILESLCSNYEISKEKFINIQIALSEVLVNAIMHGNKQNPDKKVFVNFSINKQHLLISVKDQGSGFDINKLPDPTLNDNLYKESGRGIYILKSLTDKIECITSAEGTEMKLTFYL